MPRTIDLSNSGTLNIRFVASSKEVNLISSRYWSQATTDNADQLQISGYSKLILFHRIEFQVEDLHPNPLEYSYLSIYLNPCVYVCFPFIFLQNSAMTDRSPAFLVM